MKWKASPFAPDQWWLVDDKDHIVGEAESTKITEGPPYFAYVMARELGVYPTLYEALSAIEHALGLRKEDIP